MLYVDLNELSFEKIQMYKHEECTSCGTKIVKEVLEKKKLIVEELCGRDRGRRTYLVTPSEILSPINLASIAKNAEHC